jgi:hypothetical protein
MNRFEFTSKITKINPSAKILLMSAFKVLDFELFIKVECFIQKPVFIWQWIDIIQNIVLTNLYFTNNVHHFTTITGHDA